MAKIQFFALIALFACCNAYGAEPEHDIHDHSICAPDGVAIGGYDLVSYHQASGPQLGSSDITTRVAELTYRFTSTANKERFLASPERYLPSYRGWCSMNLAMGRLACPDFSNYKIQDGRLYLFEHAGFTNGRDVWNTDPTVHRQSADQNFERFTK